MVLKQLFLSIVVFIFFSSEKIYSQINEKKLDSLCNTVHEIKTLDDFNRFEKFHHAFWLAGQDVSFNTTEPKYKNIYQKASEWVKTQNIDTLILKDKFYNLQYYFRTANFDGFLRLSLELIKNKDFLNHKESVSTILLLIDYYKQTDQFKELLEIYPLLYKQIEKHQIKLNRLTKGVKYNNLGNVYYNLRDFKNSRVYFKKCLNYYKKEKRYFELASSNNNVGLTFLNENKLDSANYYFNKAVFTLNQFTDLKKPKISSFLPVIKSNIASIWLKKKQYNKALPYFLNELKINLKNNKDFITIRAAYLKIAKVYYIKGEVKKALKYIDSTLIFLKRYPDVHQNIDAKKLQAKCLLYQGEIPKAETIFNKIKEFKDSINTIHLKNNYLLATVKYETNQKEKELALSKQKITLEKKSNSKLKIGLLLLSFVSLILFFLLQKRIKDKKYIIKQKENLQRTLEEKETLLKEVHHRVKNNLQIIASILNLQNHQINDEKLNKILEQGQSRIQSMALVHQQLYQNDKVADINMKEYLNTLINHTTISNNNSNIVFKVTTNNINFCINTAIPLGLIINELITNIFKHAFNENEKGIVSIELRKIKDHSFKLIIKDNGKGFPTNFEVKKSKSLGLKLVNILTNQLKGTVTIDKNATFIIKFRDDITV